MIGCLIFFILIKKRGVRLKKQKWLMATILGGVVTLGMLGFATNKTYAQEADFYVRKVEALTPDFIKGVDVSTLIAQENSGVHYFDTKGNQQDIFDIFKANGVNYVRIRVWNNPKNEQNQGYGAGNVDLQVAKTIGQRATKAGMKVLIDFHYSDFWADPGRQIPPKAWQSMDLSTKSQALYQYTKDSLTELLNAGVDVGMVQVGNETTSSGLCGEAGEGRYTLFAQGSKAIREVSQAFNHPMLVALHFTNPEKTSTILNYAHELSNHQIDYDVFATSYYSFWHGTLANLTDVLKTVADQYGKKTMVAETSYAYTLADGDGQPNVIDTPEELYAGNYPATVQGQANALRDVIDATAKAGSNALGVFYWEPAWISVGSHNRADNLAKWEQYGSGWASQAAIGYDPNVSMTNYGGSEWDNQALFNQQGQALPSLSVFKYVNTGYGVAPKEDERPQMPGDPLDELLKNSLLTNGQFEKDLQGYQIDAADYFNIVTSDSKSGKALHYYRQDQALSATISTSVNLTPGTYRFLASAQGSQDSQIQLVAKQKDNQQILAQGNRTSLTGWMNWQTPSIEFELTQNTTVDLNVLLNGAAGCWGTMDNWILVQTKAATPTTPNSPATPDSSESATGETTAPITPTRDQLLEKLAQQRQTANQISSADYQVTSYLNLQAVLQQIPDTTVDATLTQLEQYLATLDAALAALTKVTKPLVDVTQVDHGQIFRLYHEKSGQHLFTFSVMERDSLLKLGWQLEGTAWQLANEGQAIVRLYNPFSGEHFYSANQAEITQLVALGWQNEGCIGGSVDKRLGKPVYRFYYRAANGSYTHFFTTNQLEANLLKKITTYEGIAFYTL